MHSEVFEWNADLNKASEGKVCRGVEKCEAFCAIGLFWLQGNTLLPSLTTQLQLMQNCVILLDVKHNMGAIISRNSFSYKYIYKGILG